MPGCIIPLANAPPPYMSRVAVPESGVLFFITLTAASDKSCKGARPSVKAVFFFVMSCAFTARCNWAGLNFSAFAYPAASFARSYTDHPLLMADSSFAYCGLERSTSVFSSSPSCRNALPMRVNLHLAPCDGETPRQSVSRTCGWAPEPAPRPSRRPYRPLRSGFQGSPGAGHGRWL